MKVKPFRGIRPSKAFAKQVSSRPYDVLNSDEARAEAAGNSMSLYHIIKPEINFEEHVDEHDERVYGVAREQFDLFRKNGWLVCAPYRGSHDRQEDHPSCLQKRQQEKSLRITGQTLTYLTHKKELRNSEALFLCKNYFFNALSLIDFLAFLLLKNIPSAFLKNTQYQTIIARNPISPTQMIGPTSPI